METKMSQILAIAVGALVALMTAGLYSMGLSWGFILLFDFWAYTMSFGIAFYLLTCWDEHKGRTEKKPQ